jgi:hypothetical protein
MSILAILLVPVQSVFAESPLKFVTSSLDFAIFFVPSQGFPVALELPVFAVILFAVVSKIMNISLDQLHPQVGIF